MARRSGGATVPSPPVHGMTFARALDITIVNFAQDGGEANDDIIEEDMSKQ